MDTSHESADDEDSGREWSHVENMVVCCKYTEPFKLHDRPTSAEYFYKKEVSTALISRWTQTHVALFHTDSLLCTVIKDWRHISKILLYPTVYKDLGVHFDEKV